MNTGKTTSAKPTLKQRWQRWFTRQRQIDLLTLLACVLLAVGVNWVALQAVSSDRAMLNILSLDEWAYADFLNWAFYAAVSPFDPAPIAALHDPFGYGTIFWYLYGAVGALPHFLGSFHAEILTYRLFSMVWLGVAMWLLYKIVWLVRREVWQARLAAATLLVLPGFYFYDKVFSAEFLHVALCLATLYTFLVYQQTGLRKWCYWAALWFGIAIGLKVSAIVFLPVIVFGFIWQERNTTLLKGVRWLTYSALFTIVGFFIANPYIVLLRRDGANIYLSGIRQNLISNATNHGGSTVGLGASAWLHDVLIPIFFPEWFLILLLLGLLIVCYQQRTQLKYTAVIFGSALLYTGYIMLSVKKLWSWYLLPGVALLAIIPMMIDYKKLGLKKSWYSVACLGALLAALLFTNLPDIQARYQEFLHRETKPEFQLKQRAKEQFDAWLTTQPYSQVTILKSPYIYFDDTKFAERQLAVATIWGNLSESYITGYQPTLLLIEKNYGFTADDSVVSSWSSFPGIQGERLLFAQLIGSGLEVAGVRYHYTQVFETDNFTVYARD